VIKNELMKETLCLSSYHICVVLYFRFNLWMVMHYLFCDWSKL